MGKGGGGEAVEVEERESLTFSLLLPFRSFLMTLEAPIMLAREEERFRVQSKIQHLACDANFVWPSGICAAALFITECFHRKKTELRHCRSQRVSELTCSYFNYVFTLFRGCSSREAVGDLADYNLGGSGSGALCSSTRSRHDERGSSACIGTICQMRSKDDGLARTNQVTSVADDFGAGSIDATDRLSVVWVTEDDRALDERSLVCGQHRSCIVDELSTLTAEC